MAGLANQDVRVLASYNRRLPSRPLPVAPNISVVEWVSYAQTMPHCDVVVCHAGHGTLVRALASACAVVACPAAGDMAENAARVDWAGAGVRLPRRLLSPRTVRWAVQRALRRTLHPGPRPDDRRVERRARRGGRGRRGSSRSSRRGPHEALGMGLEPITLRLTAECSAS